MFQYILGIMEHFLSFDFGFEGMFLGYSDKILDLQKYNSDNQIKFRVFFISSDQILNKNSDTFG